MSLLKHPRLALGMAIAVAFQMVLSGANAVEKPNILFIMADDQGPWAVHLAGHPQAITPNMDRIAREGARFENAFAPTPVCSPARASILTSRYGSEFGIFDWINPRVDAGIGLPAGALTWPTLLRSAGYATGLVGKWHLGNEDEFHPRNHGYDHFSGFRGGGITPKDPVLEKDGMVLPRSGFIVDLVADDAIEFITRHKGGPFALSVHFREPHAPFLPVRDEDWAKFKDLDPLVPDPDIPGLDIPEVKKRTREYLASVTAIDRNLGRILRTLDQLQLSDRTIVIYTSDHGYNIGHHGIWSKGNARWLLKPEFFPPATAKVAAGRRPNMFDTSVKIPLSIRWPGVITPGRVIPETVSHLDWLPTFAGIAGVKLPPGAIVRGRDISGLLRGEAATWSNDYYSEFIMKHDAGADMRMYRTSGWKLIRDLNDPGRDELYDLKTDPGEKKNLIASTEPRVRTALADLDARLRTEMKRVSRAEAVHARR